MNKSNIYKRVASKLKKKRKKDSSDLASAALQGAVGGGSLANAKDAMAEAKYYSPSAAKRRAAAKAVARSKTASKVMSMKAGAYDKGTEAVINKMMDPKKKKKKK